MRYSDQTPKTLVDKIIKSLSNGGESSRATIHVSSLVKCRRLAFYDSKAETEATPVMAIGAAIHNAIQPDGCIKEMEIRIPVEPNAWLVMKPDLVCGRYVVEIKTVKDLSKTPYVHHALQLSAYMSLLHRNGILLYIDRASGKHKFYTFDVPVVELEDLIARAEDVAVALEENAPPEGDKGPWCQFCPHRSSCNQRSGKWFEAIRGKIERALGTKTLG